MKCEMCGKKEATVRYFHYWELLNLCEECCEIFLRLKEAYEDQQIKEIEERDSWKGETKEFKKEILVEGRTE